MKINRLLEITIVLMNRKMVTAKELAERFGVSARTIYRDVDVLSSAGVPVYTNKGGGGGISLLEDYSFNKALLSQEEGERLIMTLKTMEATKYPAIDSLLDKLGALFKPNTDWIEINFNEWSSNPNENNKFNDIKNAILSKSVLKFSYINANGEKSSRFVEPEKLIFRKVAWYLFGFCKNRNEHRIFRLSRIKNVAVTDIKFTPRPMSGEQAVISQEHFKSLITLKLRFTDKVLNRLYDDFDESYMLKSPDGGFEVIIPTIEDEWLYGYIMSFGKNVTVTEPEHIRNVIIERFKEVLKNYI